MLGNGRPSMIIPGYDRKSDETSVVMFHHFLIKYYCIFKLRNSNHLIFFINNRSPYLIKEYEMAKCSPNVTETEECLEKYWKSKTSFKHCKIPWKMPNDDRSRKIRNHTPYTNTLQVEPRLILFVACPPCFRNQTAGHEYCRLSFNISAAWVESYLCGCCVYISTYLDICINNFRGASVNHCNRFSAEGDSCTDIYKRGLGGRNCTICDDGCKPFEKGTKQTQLS